MTNIQPPPVAKTGVVLRLYGIVSPHNFRVSIKQGETAYPLASGYVNYNGIYSGGTTQIEITGRTFNFNTQYWVKLTDVVTGRYIIENVYINDKIAWADCNCTAPLILSVECYTDELDCGLSLSAVFVSGPPVTPSPTPTHTPTPTPTRGASPNPTPTPTPTPIYYDLTYEWEKICPGNNLCSRTYGNIKVNGVTIYSWTISAPNGRETDTLSFPSGSTITVTAGTYEPAGSGCVDYGCSCSVNIEDENYSDVAISPPDFDTITYTYTLTQDTVIQIMSDCSSIA